MKTPQKTCVSQVAGRQLADALATAISINWRIDACCEYFSGDNWNLVVHGRKPNNATIQAIQYFVHGFRTAWNVCQDVVHNQQPPHIGKRT